jgi:hypothetical protein
MLKVLPTRSTADRMSMIRPEPLPSAVRPERCRRSNDRYPIATDVIYHLVKGGEILLEGRGRSMNISSSGILLSTETALPAGVSIELQIAWPAKLDQHVALTLHIHGRTMRSEGKYTAVAISRYKFRTKRKALTAAGASIVSI